MQSKITLAWEKLEFALKQHLPQKFDELAPGATDGELAQMETELGQPFPEDLKAFYQRHSGELRFGKPYDPLFKFAYLLPLIGEKSNNVLAQWQYNALCLTRTTKKQVEKYTGPVKQVVRHPLWIPIATDHGGDGLYVDLDPDTGGNSGQVLAVNYGSSSISVIFPSLEALLNDRAETFQEKSLAPAKASKSAVAKAWKSLEKALETIEPETLEALSGPVDEEEVRYFERKTGLSLPKDVLDFFRAHNGEEPIDDDAEPIFEFAYLMPLANEGKDCALGEWEIQSDVYGEYDGDLEEWTFEGPVEKTPFSPNWLPFATEFSGNFLMFDLAPPKPGQVGQVLECDYDMRKIRVIAKNIPEFLEDKAKEFMEE